MGAFDGAPDRSAAPSLPSVSGGEFMSGGVFSKALDLLNAGSYASAGFTDALLSGQNPLEGAVTGVRDRKSYTDVLSSRGVPAPIAMGLGIAGDVFLDPSALLTAGLMPLTKAAGLARIAEVGEHLGQTVRSATDVIKQVGVRALDAGIEHATLLHHGKAQAAREAFKTAQEAGATVGEAKHLSRLAATNFNPTPQALEALKESILSSTKFGPLSASDQGPWLRAVNWMRSRLVDNVSTATRRDITAFGNVGQEFAGSLEKSELAAQALSADGMRIYRQVQRLVGNNPKDIQLFDLAANGVDDVSSYPAHIQQAVDLWRPLAQQRYKDLAERGVKQVDSVLSILYSRLSPEQKLTVARLGKETQIPEGLTGSPEWFVARLKESGGVVDEGGTIRIPLREKMHYAPAYTTKHGASRVKTQVQFQEQLMEAVRKADDTITPEQARELVEKHLVEAWTSQNDIRRQFQYGRLADLTADRETDYRRWMPKWLHDSSQRVAQAEAWGGEDQLFKSMRERLVEQGGDHQRLQKLFDISVGDMRNPAMAITKLTNRLADIMFLGPRTAILQGTQLANSIGRYGLINTVAGVVSTLRSPAIRAVARDVGATMPSLFHAADSGAMDRVLNTWHRLLGIEGADKGVRASSAVAAALSGREAGIGLAKAAASGNERAVGRLTRFLEQHGVDAKAVLERGGKLSDDEMAAMMMRGANQTNFTGSLSALPEAFRGPGGQFFLKFKNYAFQQSTFISSLVREARTGLTAGDPEAAVPLLRYAAMFPWTYSVVFRAMNALRAKPVDTEDDWEMMKNMLMTGALGFWGDTALSLGSGSEALGLGVFAGANSAMLVKGGGAVREAVLNPDISQLDPREANSLPGQIGLVRQLRALAGNAP